MLISVKTSQQFWSHKYQFLGHEFTLQQRFFEHVIPLVTSGPIHSIGTKADTNSLGRDV